MGQTYSLGFIRKRRLYVALPLLVFPFLTLLFWTLGGGQVDEPTTDKPTGFNFKLPDAYLEGKSPLDKLGFYQQAEKDSLHLAELIKNDPYHQGIAFENTKADTSRLLGLPTKKQTLESTLNTSVNSNSDGFQDDKVYQKLNQLNAALNASTDLPAKKFADEFSAVSAAHNSTIERADMERLEGMMRSVESGSGGQDPELAELNGMLEKILDIQHPQRVQQRIQEKSVQHHGQVFPVVSEAAQTPITSLENEAVAFFQDNSSQNGFYTLDEPPSQLASANAIEAVVHQTQHLVNGSTLKLRLINDVFVNGVLIPAGNFLYGTASLDGERLKVSIASFRHQNSLFPVALSVFDLDGLDGIHIPGAISRDAAKQSGEQAIQGLAVSSFDQSLGAQAANAGIELTRNLLSKKVKLVKVTVKAGYQVLLRDQKQVENL
jgi:conjugative transposon TraM protein